MIERSQGSRGDALTDLVRLRVPMSSAVAAVSRLEWDSADDVVLLEARDILRLLHRYLDSDFTAEEVESWAETIEAREDIGIVNEDEHLIRKFIFETANPELAEPITPQYARRWLDLFTHAAAG